MADPLNDAFAAMARNNRWANARLHGACAALSPGEFAAPRPGFFPSLQATLAHILEVDLYYIDALEGGGVGLAIFDRPLGAEPAAALSARQEAADWRLIDYCDRLAPGAAAGEIVMDRGAAPVSERCGAVLTHLFLHQVHHRGQAHAMLTHGGVQPPQLDEYFLAYDRAPDIAAALTRPGSRA